MSPLIIIEGLKLLEEIATKAGPGAIDTVKVIIKSLLSGHEGKTTEAEILETLALMRSELASDDDAKIKKLNEKFK